MCLGRILNIGVPTLLLAACGVGETQDRSFIEPGEWEIVNGPPGDQMTTSQCLTKEDIAKPELGVLNMDNPGCSRDRFTVRGGKIRFTLACGPGSFDAVRMTGEGTYSPTSFEIQIRSNEDGQEAEIRGERIGECQPDEQS